MYIVLLITMFLLGFMLESVRAAKRERDTAIQERQVARREEEHARQALNSAQQAVYYARQSERYWNGIAVGGKAEMLYASALESAENGDGFAAKTSAPYLRALRSIKG